MCGNILNTVKLFELNAQHVFGVLPFAYFCVDLTELCREIKFGSLKRFKIDFREFFWLADDTTKAATDF